MFTHNPYKDGVSVGAGHRPTPVAPTGVPPHRQPGGFCGLPRPIPAGPAECANSPGQNYCRGHLGGTAAVAAVATDILAVPKATTLGIFGAGVQAKSQVEAICEIRPINKVIIFDLQESMSQNLVNDLKNSL